MLGFRYIYDMAAQQDGLLWQTKLLLGFFLFLSHQHLEMVFHYVLKQLLI